MVDQGGDRNRTSLGEVDQPTPPLVQKARFRAARNLPWRKWGTGSVIESHGMLDCVLDLPTITHCTHTETFPCTINSFLGRKTNSG